MSILKGQKKSHEGGRKIVPWDALERSCAKKEEPVISVKRCPEEMEDDLGIALSLARRSLGCTNKSYFRGILGPNTN